MKMCGVFFVTMFEKCMLSLGNLIESFLQFTENTHSIDYKSCLAISEIKLIHCEIHDKKHYTAPCASVAMYRKISSH